MWALHLKGNIAILLPVYHGCIDLSHDDADTLPKQTCLVSFPIALATSIADVLQQIAEDWTQHTTCLHDVYRIVAQGEGHKALPF